MLAQLGQVFTDADWRQDIEFFVGSLDQADDFTGGACVMSVVWGGASPTTAGQAFDLSTADGSLTIEQGRVTISVTAAFFADKLAGGYQFELRHLAAGATEVLLTGEFELQRGLSQSSLGGAVLDGFAPCTVGGTVQVIRSAGPVQVIRGSAGPIGPVRATRTLDPATMNPLVLSALDNNFLLIWPGDVRLEVTIPTGLPLGFYVDLLPSGAGDIDVALVQTSGVTVVAPQDRVILQTQYAEMRISKIDNTGEVFAVQGGDLPGAAWLDLSDLGSAIHLFL